MSIGLDERIRIAKRLLDTEELEPLLPINVLSDILQVRPVELRSLYHPHRGPGITSVGTEIAKAEAVANTTLVIKHTPEKPLYDTCSICGRKTLFESGWFGRGDDSDYNDLVRDRRDVDNYLSELRKRREQGKSDNSLYVYELAASTNHKQLLRTFAQISSAAVKNCWIFPKETEGSGWQRAVVELEDADAARRVLEQQAQTLEILYSGEDGYHLPLWYPRLEPVTEQDCETPLLTSNKKLKQEYRLLSPEKRLTVVLQEHPEGISGIELLRRFSRMGTAKEIMLRLLDRAPHQYVLLNGLFYPTGDTPPPATPEGFNDQVENINERARSDLESLLRTLAIGQGIYLSELPSLFLQTFNYLPHIKSWCKLMTNFGMRHKVHVASSTLLQKHKEQLPFDVWLYRTRASGPLYTSDNRTGSDKEIDERPDHVTGADPRGIFSDKDVSNLYNILYAHPKGIRESIFPQIFQTESLERWPQNAADLSNLTQLKFVRRLTNPDTKEAIFFLNGSSNAERPLDTEAVTLYPPPDISIQTLKGMFSKYGDIQWVGWDYQACGEQRDDFEGEAVVLYRLLEKPDEARSEALRYSGRQVTRETTPLDPARVPFNTIFENRELWVTGLCPVAPKSLLAALEGEGSGRRRVVEEVSLRYPAHIKDNDEDHDFKHHERQRWRAMARFEKPEMVSDAFEHEPELLIGRRWAYCRPSVSDLRARRFYKVSKLPRWLRTSHLINWMKQFGAVADARVEFLDDYNRISRLMGYVSFFHIWKEPTSNFCVIEPRDAS